MKKALEALSRTDFTWTTHLQQVWDDLEYDVAAFHQAEREAILHSLRELQDSDTAHSPLGYVLVGQGGSGKTHLLSQLRQQAWQQGAGFILADMTGMDDFWQTLLQAYLDALLRVTPQGITQAQRVALAFYQRSNSKLSLSKLRRADAAMVQNSIHVRTQVLLHQHPDMHHSVLRYQSIMQVLMLLSTQRHSHHAYQWLLGADAPNSLGLSAQHFSAQDLISGLSWCMSLAGAWILALDQMDGIVGETQQAAARLENVGAGLLAVRDRCSRTLCVVSCLEETWDAIRQHSSAPTTARFHKPTILPALLHSDTAAQLVAARLQRGYVQHDFQPPYATWPFAPQFFDTARGELPRFILYRCNAHIKRCLQAKQISELQVYHAQTAQNQTETSTLSEHYAQLLSQIETKPLHDENQENKLFAAVLQNAARCLLVENPQLSLHMSCPDNNDNAEFHVALQHSGEPERYLYLRVLQRRHATAYQARLKAMLAAAGMETAAGHCRILVLRTEPTPSGKMTQQLSKDFMRTGGAFEQPSEQDLRCLLALHEMHTQAGFAEWVATQKPASGLAFWQDCLAWLKKEEMGH